MPWTLLQAGRVVADFRDSRQCDSALWNEIRISMAFLQESGPVGAGTDVAKKLGGGDGIWELKARLDNRQPRLLFYQRPTVANVLVFVHAFLKKGNKDYGPAIKLAKERRRNIEGGRLRINVVVVH